MKNFIHKDYLLTTDFARELYHRFAENEPIIDYHCHLPPREIAEDRRWKDISEVWLGGDHYKWRQMRSNGVDEEFCTGSASGHDKFVKYAETMEKLVKNPLFDWSHLELKRYFGVSERLCAASAERIWRKCNAVVAKKDFSARSLMVKSNVKAVCTTDDPDDDLAWHQKIARSFKGVKVLPTWRPDRILKEALKKKKDPMKHLAERHDYFAKHGCVLSDYGITAIPPKGRLQDYLVECMKLDAKAGWASQLHFNCIRNPNSRMFRKLGPDTGFDFIGEAGGLANLAELFDRLEREDLLPKTIVYSLNPSDFAALGSIIGSFQKGPVVGKLQLGSAWWFNDHKRGMTEQLESLAAEGYLAGFVGMLTDSRSFLSYARHEYFRRILCELIGSWVENGEYPNDERALRRIVEGICYRNAEKYFSL